MTAKKKTPERMCCACNMRRDKRELLRIVRTPDHTAMVDATGRANGRGVYLCRDAACVRLALKKKAIGRGLKIEDPTPLYEELLESLV